MKTYQPPFSITPAIIRLISEISEKLGYLAAVSEKQLDLRLRRINRIRTIQGSLAIEGNTLSEEQITAILEGKRVIAPPKEVQEARNAIKAYELFESWQPESESDLLKAHETLMAGLIDDAGHYRVGNVGVMKGEQVVHMAPPADRVKKLMTDLLSWLPNTDQHPLIVSSVFHYEFEFIHPFSDGNGRMGRLWQTLILSQWNPLLAQLPVESMVYAQQDEYYQAINESTQATDSAPFIEFMLGNILSAIEENLSENDGISDGINDGLKLTPLDKEILSLIDLDSYITNATLAEKTGKSVRSIERRMKVLKEHNVIERVGAKKTGYWKVLKQLDSYWQ